MIDIKRLCSMVCLLNQPINYNICLAISTALMELKEQPLKFKILLIGPSGVGKTSLLIKYVHNKFTYDYQVTLGVEFNTKTVQVNEKTSINLQIWDTAGQQAYRAIVKSHYKGVCGIILLYSIDNKETFDKLGMWMRQIKENVHDECVVFLVGTKLDLDDTRKVSKEQGQEYAKSLNNCIGFLEISAKTGQYVKELFDKLSKTLFKKYQSSKAFKELVKPINTGFQKSESFQIKASDKKPQQSSGCC